MIQTGFDSVFYRKTESTAYSSATIGLRLPVKQTRQTPAPQPSMRKPGGAGFDGGDGDEAPLHRR